MKSERYRPANTSGANCVRFVSLSGAAGSWLRRPHSSRGARLRRSAESPKRLCRQRSKAAWSAGEAGGQTRCSSSATSEAMRSTCSPRSGRSSSAAEATPAKSATASRNRMELARGRQVIGEQVVGELAPHRLAHVERIAEVDAAPDAHLLVLIW